MQTQWLRESANAIAAICAVIAVAECALDEGAHCGALKMICGAAAALSILTMATDCLRNLF